MKKFTTFAYMMAIALVSTAGFTSCKNEEEVGEGNYNGETVKAEFAISLPDQLKGGTGVNRMPSTTVQKEGADDFQGMTGIMLVPFAEQDTVEATDVRLGNNIMLTEGVTTADINKPSAAKVYSNVSIPLSTATFLFYAKSAATGTKFAVGSLLPKDTASTKNPAAFRFDLEQIVPSPTFMSASGEGGQLMAYLTSIACASDGQTTPKCWYEYTTAMDAAMKAMFDTYTSINGLSSFEVERVLTDLYKSLKPLYSTKPIAKAIMDSIANATYATVNTSTDEVALVSTLDNFPGSYNLPDGSINIQWVAATHKFAEGAYSNMALPSTFVYPAQLWYFADSRIKTSNTSKKTMYDNTNNWATVLGAHTDAVSVNSMTRAVAIVDPVQYAVARFDTQVRLKAASMEDNSATAVGIGTAVDCSAGFPISAVLVGGQKQVMFDFTPNASATTEYTVYDNVMASTVKTPAEAMVASYSTTAYSTMNHTLVLESGTSDVMIALEMTNTTGKDFYGVGGQLIPKGGKFYVIAKLEASAATETGSHVFKQDYTTTAKLTLKDLKSAYNTIPDLRTPQLEIGFSVDLTWQAGHTYEIEF